MKIGILGGYKAFSELLNDPFSKELQTPYGAIDYQSGTYQGKEVIFIKKEGRQGPIPPHLHNHRANIWAMKKLDVHSIIDVFAVGSVNDSLEPDNIVFPSQFLDFTKSRVSTFYEGKERGVVHVDMTSPYCQNLSETLASAARKVGLTAHTKATFACYEGPRFRTPAEADMFAKLGADLVGMSGIPEVILAREAEMCYAAAAMVVQFATSTPVTREQRNKSMRSKTEVINQFLLQSIESVDVNADCSCHHALAEYGNFKL